MKNEILARAMAVLDIAEYGSDAFDVAAWATWAALDPGQREVFKQLLFNGPVYDGDICSKSARDSLLDLGLAVRCCFKGEQGHTAATYRAYTVYKASDAEKPKVSPFSRVVASA